MNASALSILLLIVIISIVFMVINTESFQGYNSCPYAHQRRMHLMEKKCPFNCPCRRMYPDLPECPYSYAKQNCGWGHRGAWWRDF